MRAQAWGPRWRAKAATPHAPTGSWPRSSGVPASRNVACGTSAHAPRWLLDRVPCPACRRIVSARPPGSSQIPCGRRPRLRPQPPCWGCRRSPGAIIGQESTALSNSVGRRSNTAARCRRHRMPVQRHRAVPRVPQSNGFGELGQVGHVPPPIVDPHHARVVHVTDREPVPTVFEHAHRIAVKQEIPDQLRVFARVLGESVGDDDGATERGCGAVLAQDRRTSRRRSTGSAANRDGRARAGPPPGPAPSTLPRSRRRARAAPSHASARRIGIRRSDPWL